MTERDWCDYESWEFFERPNPVDAWNDLIVRRDE